MTVTGSYRQLQAVAGSYWQLLAVTESTITTMYKFLRSVEYQGNFEVILVTEVTFLGTAKIRYPRGDYLGNSCYPGNWGNYPGVTNF
jgi:hypothetical protein